MKFIDENGRILNKINILDLLFIILIVFLSFLAFLKVSGNNLEDLSASKDFYNVEFTLSIPMSTGYLDSLKVGDQLSETKQFLNGYVEDIEINPVIVNNLDKDGYEVESIDPTQELAYVTVSANVPYENMSYKLGNQELREGKILFFETQLYRVKAQIISLKVVN